MCAPPSSGTVALGTVPCRNQEKAMATIIPVKIDRYFDVAASPEEMFELITNVRRSASHFPDIQELVQLDDQTWRWEMQPVSYAGVAMQPKYVLRYSWDADRLHMRWDPVPQDDHFVVVEGHWQLQPRGTGTNAYFLLDMQFDLPVPQMIAGMAKQLLTAELGKGVDQYVAAMTRTLGPATP